MKVRPNLLDKNSPKGLEVIQLTTESEVPNSPIWSHRSSLRNSKRLLLHRSARPPDRTQMTLNTST